MADGCEPARSDLSSPVSSADGLDYRPMLTSAVLLHILAKVQYRDWRFHTMPAEAGFLLQVRWEEHGDVQHGRKWYLSPHATEGEVIQTALLAVLTATEHEVREAFTVNGVAIYAPHFDPMALVKLASDHASRQVRT